MDELNHHKTFLLNAQFVLTSSCGFGPLAHLVERTHGMGEVAGSSPAWSTRLPLDKLGVARGKPSLAGERVECPELVEGHRSSGRSIVVVYTLRVREVRVRFSAPRHDQGPLCPKRRRAYSLVVRRVIRIDEAGVRFPLGPPLIRTP